jgi:CheY-like chemotaxis protein
MRRQSFVANANRHPLGRRAIWIESLLEENVTPVLRGSELNPRYEIDEGLWPILADATHVRRVVSDLVRNARAGAHGEGTIMIRLENRWIASDWTLADGRYVELSVSGAGGSTAEKLSYLMPAADEEPDAESSDVIPVRDSIGRLLVMDDELEVRRVLALCLRELGYEVACAADGEEALALFDLSVRDQRPFDAVILDLGVRSGVGGLETLQRLKQLHGTVRAIASSGLPDSPILADHERFGFDGILPKPYRFTELALVLRSVVGAPPG